MRPAGVARVYLEPRAPAARPEAVAYVRGLVDMTTGRALARNYCLGRDGMMRRRMSIERLARCHVAVRGSGAEADRARAEISVGEVEGLEFGGTFVEPLLLNACRLDLYEEEAHVIRGPEAVELARFDSSLAMPAGRTR